MAAGCAGSRGAFSVVRAASTACFISEATRSHTTNGRSSGAMVGPLSKCCPTSGEPKPMREAPMNGMGAAARLWSSPRSSICRSAMRSSRPLAKFPWSTTSMPMSPRVLAGIDTNMENGRRASTAVAYVQPARRRGNLKLLSGTIAARIVSENSRARVVEILKDGLRKTIWAEREIILCGGTVNSPQLLMLSGIGPADHLSRLGIPVVDYAPEVGRNLQNHPSYALRFACSQPVTAYKYLNSRAALGIGLRYALSRGGSLGESYVATGGYTRSDPALAVSDTIVVMVPALVTRGGVGFRLVDLFPERHGFTVMVGSGRPLSRGWVL